MKDAHSLFVGYKERILCAEDNPKERKTKTQFFSGPDVKRERKPCCSLAYNK